MKHEEKNQNNQGRRKKMKLFKPRKKKSAEEDAAIQYLRAQYEKVRKTRSLKLFYLNKLITVIILVFLSQPVCYG